ncbi:MAG: methylenetetrahydrofolate reductase [Candidatus Omnitrophica bacterium]|nr:methylenetetrahydrofolate reductase [Candidatus Omnitrophota bacterium]
MSLRKAIESKKFIVTTEAGPPKGIDASKMLEEARPLAGRVDAVNVTDLQSAVMKLGSLVSCHLLKEIGIDPVFQITCRDRNRLALQSDILSAAALGIENILVLTGDHPLSGDHPQAKAVFDLDSVQLLEAVSGLKKGKDMTGNKLEGSPKLCVGAVVNPLADPLEPELIKMEKKVAAGAEFFQTQAVYDVRGFEEFMKKAKRFRVPIIAGIILLKSARMATYMNENIAGIHVPDELIKKIDHCDDKPKKSIEIAAGLIDKLKGPSDGVHIMPIGWERYLPQVLDAAGL